MASVCGAVDVLSFSSHHIQGDTENIQLGTSDLLTDLFRVDAGRGSASGGRVQKRRKLDHNINASLQPVDMFDTSQSVVLAHVVLDLVCPLPQIVKCSHC